METFIPILSWWFTIQIISIVGLPYTVLIFRRFPLHGYALNKTLSILLVGYSAWLLAMLGFGALASSSAALALIILAGVGVWISRWASIKPLLSSIGKKWKSILGIEALFILFLLIGLWLHSHGAVGTSILGTEKMMDLAFLSSAAQSPNFPPQDPWLSGYAINYYYLGYVLLATIKVLSGVSVGVAFTVGLATIFALSAMTIIGLLSAMILSIRSIDSKPQYLQTGLACLLGIIMVLFLGNQGGLFQVIFGSPQIETLGDQQILSAMQQKLHGNSTIEVHPAIQTHPSDFGLIEFIQPDHTSFDWWWPSRMVWDTVSATPTAVEKQYAITEFPFFSFYLGDLHPHVLSLPFVILILALAFEMLSSEKPLFLHTDRAEITKMIITCLILGSMYMINSWDTPTYALIYFGALFLCYRQAAFRQGDKISLQKIAKGMVLLIFGCILVNVPFLITFQSFVGSTLPQNWISIPGLNAVRKIISLSFNHTGWYAFISIFGLSSLAVLTFAVHRNTYEVIDSPLHRKPDLLILGIIIAIAIIGTLIGFPLLSLFPLIYFLLRKAGQQTERPVNTFVFLSISVAYLVILAADIVYIRDPFENRMNTIFKFYYQAWIILAVMAAFAMATLLQFDFRRRWFSPLWIMIIICFFAGAAVYPLETLTNGQPWSKGAFILDGLGFLQQQSPDESAAMAWIATNTQPSDIILTAVGSSYDDGTGRIAAGTGRPTVLGWSGSHERLWRSGSPEILATISNREQDIPLIYKTRDATTVHQLVDQYGVNYIYIGPKERQLYPGNGLNKFDSMYKLVFSSDEVQIYQVGY